MKYVDNCSRTDVGCAAGIQSVAPLFTVDPSFTDYLAVIEPAGDTVPGTPRRAPCPLSSSPAIDIDCVFPGNSQTILRVLSGTPDSLLVNDNSHMGWLPTKEET